MIIFLMFRNQDFVVNFRGLAIYSVLPDKVPRLVPVEFGVFLLWKERDAEVKVKHFSFYSR
jgi:hypothetical protein